ncbi:TerB family tellurite resistance protein [Thermodesulfobacteriota bacterium]
MLDLFKKIIGNKQSTVETVKNETSKKDINLATCALLLELASIDGEFSSQERDNIVSIFKTKYNVSDDDIAGLLKSSEEVLEESIDLWQFTNLINQNYSLEEKLDVIETVWEVAYSDGRLDHHEDYLVHKVATLLRLSHKQLIDAKLKVLHREE